MESQVSKWDSLSTNYSKNLTQETIYSEKENLKITDQKKFSKKMI